MEHKVELKLILSMPITINLRSLSQKDKHKKTMAI